MEKEACKAFIHIKMSHYGCECSLLEANEINHKIHFYISFILFKANMHKYNSKKSLFYKRSLDLKRL